MGLAARQSLSFDLRLAGKQTSRQRREEEPGGTTGGSDNDEFGWSLSEHKHRRLFWLLLGAVGLVQVLQVKTNALRLTFAGGEVYFSVLASLQVRTQLVSFSVYDASKRAMHGCLFNLSDT